MLYYKWLPCLFFTYWKYCSLSFRLFSDVCKMRVTIFTVIIAQPLRLDWELFMSWQCCSVSFWRRTSNIKISWDQKKALGFGIYGFVVLFGVFFETNKHQNLISPKKTKKKSSRYRWQRSIPFLWHGCIVRSLFWRQTKLSGPLTVIESCFLWPHGIVWHLFLETDKRQNLIKSDKKSS